MEINPEVLARAVDVLERAARQRQVLTYKQLSEQVPGLPTRGPVMTAALLAVSAYSWQKHQVLLPVLVVNASGQKLPGEGFYESLRSYRPNDAAGEPAVLARRERERVYRPYPSQSYRACAPSCVPART